MNPVPEKKPEVGDVWVGAHSGLDVFVESREGDWVTLYYTADRERDRSTLHIETVVMFYKFKCSASPQPGDEQEVVDDD